jgi:PPP family 3-phenylpropionic acid transporter
MTIPQHPPPIRAFTPSRRARAAAIYFFFFAAIAAIAPFLVLFYRQQGFSGGQIGLLLSIGPLIALFSAPFWTGVADTRGRHAAVLTLAMLAGMLIYAFFPAFELFALYLAAVVALALLTSPILSLIDTSILHMLGDQKERYGRVRLWGTIGWGLSAPVVGEVLARRGLEWMFWMYAAFMLVSLFLVRGLDFEATVERTPFWVGVRGMLRDRAWWLVLSAGFIAAFGLAAQTNYLGLLLDEMGAPTSYLGVAITLSTLFELPILFGSSYLLARRSNRSVLFFAVAITGLRCLLYAVVATPGQVLAIQLLHGLTYSLILIAGVNFAAKHAPPGLSATAQGLFNAVQGGLGGAAGNLVCGLLLDQFGIAGMMASLGWLTFGALAVIVFLEMRSSPQPASAP